MCNVFAVAANVVENKRPIVIGRKLSNLLMWMRVKGMKKLVLVGLLALGSVDAMAADKVKTVVAKGQAAVITPDCTEASVKGDYILSWQGVSKNGQAIGGSYSIGFDGKSSPTGIPKNATIDGGGSTLGIMELTAAPFSAWYGMGNSCSIILTFDIPLGSNNLENPTSMIANIFLDKMVGAKPYLANHGTGRFVTSGAFNFDGSITLQRWIEKK